MPTKQQDRYYPYKSSLEKTAANLLELTDCSIKWVYEPGAIILVPSFSKEGTFIKENKKELRFSERFQAITYTPDFVLTDKNGIKHYIELKGYIYPIYPVKRKLFLKWLLDNEPTSKFYEIKTISKLKEVINNIYEQKDIKELVTNGTNRRRKKQANEAGSDKKVRKRVIRASKKNRQLNSILGNTNA